MCVLLLGGFQILPAQLDQLQFHLGGSYEFMRITQQIGGAQVYANYFTLSGGANYVFWQSNDQISLSANPNVSAGFTFNNQTGFSTIVQVPAYVLLRLGAASTKYNQQKFGAGAGLGLAYTYVNEKAIIYNQRFYTLAAHMYHPVATAQITFQNDFRVLTVRAYGSLYPYTGKFIQPAGDEKFDYDILGLAILYNFQ